MVEYSELSCQVVFKVGQHNGLRLQRGPTQYLVHLYLIDSYHFGLVVLRFANLSYNVYRMNIMMLTIGSEEILDVLCHALVVGPPLEKG